MQLALTVDRLYIYVMKHVRPSVRVCVCVCVCGACVPLASVSRRGTERGG
jgi:hypothetical protein